MVASTYATPAAAYSLMRMRTAALDIEQAGEPEVSTDADGNSVVSVKLNTSSDVASLVITDKNGNVLSPEQFEAVAQEHEDDGITEWTVNISVTDCGTYTYTVTGAYENGYTDDSKAITVVVSVDKTETDDESSDGDGSDTSVENSFFEELARVFRKLIDFFRAILELLSIAE